MRIKGICQNFAISVLFATIVSLFLPDIVLAYGVGNSMARERADIRNNSNSDENLTEPLDNVPSRKLSGFIFHRASKIPATEQFAAAAKLEDSNRWAEACSAYDTLVRSFPFSPAASQAQLRLSRLREKMGKYKKAFEEYYYMLYFYPENAPSEALLRQMYAIADYYRNKGKKSRSLEYFQRIAQIAPQWKYTPQVLLDVGEVQFKNKDYYEAAESFDTITSNHPGSPEAKIALEKHALVLHALSLKYHRDEAILAQAIAVTTAALRDGDLTSPYRSELTSNLKDLTLRRSERFYEMAVFYDKPSYANDVKIAAYKDYLRRFPNAAHSKMARSRLDELEAENK